MSDPSPARVLALDFDGVISDSAAEAMVVAARAWCALHPEEPFAGRLTFLAHGDEPPDPDARRFVEGFRRLLPLGNRAEDFGVALWILARGDQVDDQRGYDAVRRDFSPQWVERFHHRFYRERGELRDGDPERWLALQSPYRPLLDLLAARRGEVELAIATAKDRESVRTLLESYRASGLFPEERVWDKEAGVDKSAHLAAISEALGVPFPRITFVDDKLNHLERTRHLGVRGVLAAWGFNGPRERDAAHVAGFEVATLESADEVLFGLPHEPT